MKMGQQYNAFQHGLFAKEVLLPFEDRRQFLRFCREIIASLNPENEIQGHFAREIAEDAWKIKRIDKTIQAQRQSIYERLSPQMVAQFAALPEKLHASAPPWLTDLSSKVTQLEKKFYRLVCSQYDDCLKNYVGIPNLVAVYKQYPQLFLCASAQAEESAQRPIINTATNTLDPAWQQSSKALWLALEKAYQLAYFYAHWDSIRKLAHPYVQSWFYLQAAQHSRLEHHQSLGLKARMDLRKQLQAYERLKKNAVLYSGILHSIVSENQTQLTQGNGMSNSKDGGKASGKAKEKTVKPLNAKVKVSLAPMQTSLANLQVSTQAVIPVVQH